MTIETIFLQTAMAVLASFAFAVIYQVKYRHLPIVAVGGGIAWLIYCLSYLPFENGFFSNFCGALFAAAYSEATARLRRTPVVVFLLPCLIPLVPGSGLYYTLSYAILRNTELMNSYLRSTVEAAFGIAAGVIMVSVLMRLLRPRRQNAPQK